MIQVNPDPIRIQGFDDQKIEEKNTAEKQFCLFFLDSVGGLLEAPVGILKRFTVKHCSFIEN